jgi:hypothetical protein
MPEALDSRPLGLMKLDHIKTRSKKSHACVPLKTFISGKGKWSKGQHGKEEKVEHSV